MNELIKILIGICVLILGYPIGMILRKNTIDEQKDGRKWFKILTLFGLISGLLGFLIKKDWIMFTGFFIAVVTSRSLIFSKPKA